MQKSDLVFLLSMLTSLSTARNHNPSWMLSRSFACFSTRPLRSQRRIYHKNQVEGNNQNIALCSDRNMDQDIRKVTTSCADVMKIQPEQNVVAEYKESTSERDTRLIFESFPFHTAKYTIDAMIRSPDHTNPTLRRVKTYLANNGEESKMDNTGNANDVHYSRLFEPLFGREGKHQSDENIDNYKQQLVAAEIQRKTKGRQNFKIQVAYRGIDFCGWQIQFNHPKPSVQQTLMDILDPVLRPPPSAARKAKKEKFKQVQIKVCGRTDAGVSALSQVCRVRTFRRPEEVDADRIQMEINNSIFAKNGSLRCVNVDAIDESFHPTFSAKCRAYAYLIDLDNATDEDSVPNPTELLGSDDYIQGLSDHHLPLLNAMLQELEGIELDYYSLSYGKVETTTSLCMLHRARASMVEFTPPSSAGGTGTNSEGSTSTRRRAICIELVGNRFLRRMVRILVATAVREALCTFRESQRDGTDPVDIGATKLLSIVASKERRSSAKASPPNGLMFVGAEFRSGASDEEVS